MTGGSFELARAGVIAALNYLAPENNFGLVIVGSDARLWKTEVVPAAKETKDFAAEVSAAVNAGKK